MRYACDARREVLRRLRDASDGARRERGGRRHWRGGGAVADPVGGATRAPLAPASGAAPAASHFTPAFAVVFAAIFAIGLGAAALIMRQQPQRERQLASAAPQTGAAGNLPPGHPQVIKIPDRARKFIDELQAKAEAAPNDVAAWDRFGDAAERAAMFDPSYYPKAADAYAHVLKLDPDDLPALRGVGNIDYDRRHYDEAIAAYEHYLSRKPDDARVRTDLGTMYLSSGNPDVAIVQYKKVVTAHPDFFEAYFNLGVAYAEQENKPVARSYFQKARTLAPDDKARGEIDQMLATMRRPWRRRRVRRRFGGQCRCGRGRRQRRDFPGRVRTDGARAADRGSQGPRRAVDR